MLYLVCKRVTKTQINHVKNMKNLINFPELLFKLEFHIKFKLIGFCPKINLIEKSTIFSFLLLDKLMRYYHHIKFIVWYTLLCI